MDEQVIDDLYKRAISKGYKKDRSEFIKLLHSDDEVLNDNYSYVQSKGYKKSINDFSSLVGKGSIISLKKKGATELPSETNMESSSLVTPPQKGQKPSVSSGIKQPEIFTDLPTKEDNKYRIVNNKWQRLVPGATKWEDINNEGSVSYLNKHYGKNVKTPTSVKITKTEKGPDFSDINSKLVSKTEEEVIPILKKKYGVLGFSFEESGLGTDYVKITSKNGNTIEVGLDENNPDEALKLRNFLSQNKSSESSIGNLKDISFKEKEFVDKFKQLDYDDAKSVVEDRLNMFKKNIFDYEFVGDKQEADRFRSSLKEFYNSEAYKIYKSKKSEAEQKQSEKLDSLYYELKGAKSEKDKKIIKSKINTYLSESVIKGQTEAYSTQLNDVNNSYKKLKAAINQFEIDKKNIDQIQDPVEREAMTNELNKRAEYLDSRRQEIVSEGKSIISEMKKLDYLTGKYILDKEKTGNIGGGILNSLITGVSKIIETPMIIGSELGKEAAFDVLSPEKKQYLKDKGYTDDQIKNYLANESLKKSKEDLRKGLVSAIGHEGTTEEYMKSKDRGFLENVIYGVAESLPAMLIPGGSAARFSALAAQSYSSIEDEMLNDKDFEATSAAERSLVATPYATVMGFLENMGFSKLVSKSPIAKSLIFKTISGAAEKIGGKTTKEVFEKILEKELKSNMAKFGVKIVGGTLAEAETGALQSLAADIGIKKTYNAIKNALDKNEGLKKELTGGEYFETPETIGEGFKQVLTDAAAEAIGGGIMSATISGVERIATGNINLYTDEDLDFLKTLTEDPEIKKVVTNTLKTNIIKGTMTKSEAERVLNDYNTTTSRFNSIPDNIKGNDLKRSIELISEKEKINEEIQGKDEAIIAPQKARITEINNELSKISEDAIQKQTAGEVPVQPEATSGPQVGQGEPEAKPQGVTEEGEEEITFEKAGQKEVLSGVEITYPTKEEATQRTDERSTSKYVEENSSDLNEEDVNKLTSELGGEFGLVTANNPMKQPLTEEENATLNEKAKSWLEERGYKPRRVIGKYGQAEKSFFVPNLSKQDAIDFAKEFNQESVAHSEGLIYQDGSMNPRVKSQDNFSFEGFTPESDYVSVVRTPEGLRTFAVGYDLDTKVEPKTDIKTEEELQAEVESLGEFLGSTDQEVDQNVKRISDKKMAKIVARAAKALSKILPDVRFVVHQNEDSFRKITGEERNQESRGAYVNGTVHINLSKANARTVAHEVFHAILLNKVKTDANAQAVTKRMVQAIANKIEGNKDLKSYLDDFITNYEENIQDEEKLAELVGKLAENYNSFGTSIKDLIKRWLDKLADIFGLDPFNRNEVYDMLNTIARKIAKGEVISEEDISSDVLKTEGIQTEIISSNKIRKSRNVSVKEGYKLSYVTKDDIIDIESFINEVAEKGQKIWFWMADQLGKGYVFDEVSNDQHYLDAGPSFALDPENRKNNIIWASGLAEQKLSNLIKGSDYIFIVSGSPIQSKLYNKAVFDLYVKKIGDFKSFKKYLIDSGTTKQMKEVLDAHNSWETLANDTSTDNPKTKRIGTGRKKFLIEINKASTKPNTAIYRILNNRNAFIDINSIRDDFYRDNNFEINDIMLVLKPTELGGKSAHSTYETNVMGEVIGVPDKVINAYDILSDEVLAKYKKASSRTTQQAITAPQGQGIRTVKKVEPSIRKQKALPTEVSEKLTEDGKGNYVFHHYSKEKRDVIKPRSGDNIITSKDEAAALSSVGGAAQYYTMADQVEPGVGPILHTVVIPKDKVYYLQNDSENFYDQARKEFEQVRPGQAFNPNYQAAWIAKVANDNGYDMLISNWRGNEFRAQTTKELTPIEGNINFKERAKEEYKIGDEVMVYGMKAKITSVDGPNLEFKGDGGGGAINIERSPRSITKIVPTTEEVNSEVDSMDQSIRKQKANTIENLVKRAKDAGYSDAAIVQYLKNNGYTSRQAIDAIQEYDIKKEGIWIANDGSLPKKVLSSIEKARRSFLSARGFMAKSMFKSFESKNSAIARDLNVMMNNIYDFQKLYKKYTGDKEQLIKDFDAFIRGDQSIVLPEEIATVGREMRDHIDSLSRLLIDSGAVDVFQAETIRKNIGTYLTRSYEIFDNKNYRKKVSEEVKNQAINYFKREYLSWAQDIAAQNNSSVDEELDRLVGNKIDEILKDPLSSMIIAGSNEASKDLSVLKQRQDIPKEIRDLMGEYQDPVLAYAETISSLSSLAANHNFLVEVKNNGLGKYFFEKNDPKRPKGFNYQIAAEGSKTMSPLNGLYTTKEIAESFKEMPKYTNMFIKQYFKAVAFVKYSKTILSVGTHSKNIFGNIGFMWMNGHLDPKEMKDAYSTVRNDIRKLNKNELRDRANYYISIGVMKQSAGLKELQDMFKDANYDVTLAERLSYKKIGILGKVKRLGKKGTKYLEDLYQAEDDFFKVLAYEHELSRYSEALFDKNKNDLTKDELDQVNNIVVENVKNTYPNYDRIGKIGQLMRRVPFGNFISFQIESYRTLFNTIAIAKNEMASDNEKIRNIGLWRMIGASTYLTAKTAIIQSFSVMAGQGLTSVLGYLFDDDDDKEKQKDIKKFVAPWSKDSDLIVLKSENGNIKYIDFSSTDPHGSLKKTINAFLQGDTGVEMFANGLYSFLEPFVGPEMTAKTIDDVIRNKNKYGGNLYNPEDTESNKLLKICDYIYSTLEPGTLSSIRRASESQNIGQELIANLTGYRIYNVDVAQQFGFKMNDYSQRIKDAKRLYNSVYYNMKSTQSEINEAYDRAQAALDKIHADMLSDYDSATRLGADSEALINSMKDDANMSNSDINVLMTGEMPMLKYK